MIEYKTTCVRTGRLDWDDWGRAEGPSPEPPEDDLPTHSHVVACMSVADGECIRYATPWEMCGSAAEPGVLHWFWKREVKELR